MPTTGFSIKALKVKLLAGEQISQPSESGAVSDFANTVFGNQSIFSKITLWNFVNARLLKRLQKDHPAMH